MSRDTSISNISDDVGGCDSPSRPARDAGRNCHNVEKFLGWVSTVADFCGSFGQLPQPHWLISENAPRYMPSFDLKKQIAQSAEKHGLGR